MRVIAGEFRSRKLKTLEGLTTRPTPDRLRETLFDILMPRLEGCVFVDGYAGSGAVGIEALSRGASRSIFIEKNRAAVEIIRENLHSLKLTSRAEVFTGKTANVLERIQAGIVFLDPPYELIREYQESLEILGAKEAGLVVVQHAARADLANDYKNLRRYRVVKQGDNSLSFYRYPDQQSGSQPDGKLST